MRYCIKCLYPETKPDLWFNDKGICSACINYDNRKNIDWKSRQKEFFQIVERYRYKNGENYDCIVPVSGGKDSTYQVIKLLELGLNPLAVTAETDCMTDIGRRNLENLKCLGIDHVHVTPNPQIRRKIARIALEQVGDIQWAEHVTIFTAPVRVAVEKKIPLIVWGENAQHEYGGPAAAVENNILDRRWLEEFGGLLGMRVTDVLLSEGIKPNHLLPYTYPSDQELQAVGVTGLYLGYYFPWDGYNNALLAQAHGFEFYPKAVEHNFVNYENLDNYFHGIHDYFKFLKYGFGRATDQANNHIRRERVSRAQALDVIKDIDGKFPWFYLGKPLAEILEIIDMSVSEFQTICHQFTNKKLFLKNADGSLMRDAQGSLIKTHYDNKDKKSALSDELQQVEN